MQASVASLLVARPMCRRIFVHRLPSSIAVLRHSSLSAPKLILQRGNVNWNMPSCGFVANSKSFSYSSPTRCRVKAQIADTEVSQEVDQYNVVTFYWLTDIEDPHALVEIHREFLKDRDCKGRIYINNQGINAQLSGLGSHAAEYAEFVMQDERFEGCEWTQFPVSTHQFPKLNLRFKPNLVSLNGGTQHLPLTDPLQRAVKIDPQEWKQRITECVNGESEGVVLDVRNDYEWDAGHFLKADRPTNERFRDTQLDAPGEPLHDIPKDTPIYMYCTGGIRCDVYSTQLRQAGFTSMYTLKGGVQNYLKEEGRDLWDGELFVFDDRLATPNMPNPDQTQGSDGMAPHLATRRCYCCTEPKAAPPHRNCANVDCNRLFLVCAGCLESQQGFCSAECLESSIRSRPLLAQGTYTKWHQYSPEYVSVRGDGRARRRRAKRERQHKKEFEEAMQAVKSGKVDWSEKPKNRYAQKRLQRRVELAKKLMDMGKLPPEADGEALMEAIGNLDKHFGRKPESVQ